MLFLWKHLYCQHSWRKTAFTEHQFFCFSFVFKLYIRSRAFNLFYISFCISIHLNFSPQRLSFFSLEHVGLILWVVFFSPISSIRSNSFTPFITWIYLLQYIVYIVYTFSFFSMLPYMHALQYIDYITAESKNKGPRTYYIRLYRQLLYSFELLFIFRCQLVRL